MTITTYATYDEIGDTSLGFLSTSLNDEPFTRVLVPHDHIAGWIENTVNAEVTLCLCSGHTVVLTPEGGRGAPDVAETYQELVDHLYDAIARPSSPLPSSKGHQP